MDQAPTANPYAKIVTECFQECPALETPAQNWSPNTPPDLTLVKRSGLDGVRKPTVDEDEDTIAATFFDKGCEEANVPSSSGGCSPSLACGGGNLVGQGQQTSVVEDVSKLDLHSTGFKRIGSPFLR